MSDIHVGTYSWATRKVDFSIAWSANHAQGVLCWTDASALLLTCAIMTLSQGYQSAAAPYSAALPDIWELFRAWSQPLPLPAIPAVCG